MKVEPFVRSAFNYDRDVASDESGINCQERVDPETGELVATPSLAKQSFAEEADINTIVRRFGLTGQLPVGVRMPTYGDFLDVPDYHQAMNAIVAANEAFAAMPAEVRYRFNNDPGRFVEFCSNEANRDEAVKLGLVMPQAAALAAAGVAGAPGGGAVAPEVVPLGAGAPAPL